MEMTRSRMNVTGLILKALSLILGFWFVGSGMTKLLRVESQVQNFERWGYPDWFLIVTGVIELTAAILLIVSVVFGRVATIGAVLITGVMCGALYTRISNGDAVSTIIPPVVLLIVAIIVAWFRRDEMLARA